jgi:hypothetical protein
MKRLTPRQRQAQQLIIDQQTKVLDLALSHIKQLASEWNQAVVPISIIELTHNTIKKNIAEAAGLKSEIEGNNNINEKSKPLGG